MCQIQIEPVFRADYKRVASAHPQIKKELKTAIDELFAGLML